MFDIMNNSLGSHPIGLIFSANECPVPAGSESHFLEKFYICFTFFSLSDTLRVFRLRFWPFHTCFHCCCLFSAAFGSSGLISGFLAYCSLGNDVAHLFCPLVMCCRRCFQLLRSHFFVRLHSVFIGPSLYLFEVRHSLGASCACLCSLGLWVHVFTLEVFLALFSPESHLFEC